MSTDERQRSTGALVLGLWSFVFRHLRVGSEPWQWVREWLTFMPGRAGQLIRSRFYQLAFKEGGRPLVVAGAYIESPESIQVLGFVTFARNSWVSGEGGLSLGNNVGIGPGVVIHTANHIYADANRPFFEQGHEQRPVTIEEDVWIAAGARILPGTYIERGAIVMAGAVVSGRVKANQIVGGNPARVFGIRGRPSIAEMERARGKAPATGSAAEA